MADASETRQREALVECVAAARAVELAEGWLAQPRALDQLRSAAIGFEVALQNFKNFGTERWCLARELGDVIGLLRFDRLPVDETVVVLREVYEALAEGEGEPADVEALRAAVAALGQRASKPLVSPPMPAWIDALLAATTLGEYTRHRLEQHLRAGRPLHLMCVPDELEEQVLARIHAGAEQLIGIRRDLPAGHPDQQQWHLIAADDLHAQLGEFVDVVELSRPEEIELADRRTDELAYLRGSWAPDVADDDRLASLHESFEAAPAPAAEVWQVVGPLRVELAAVPELEVERSLTLHRQTVMDLHVAASGQVVSVDFHGNWIVWTQDRLLEQLRGTLGRETRAVRLSDDGRRLAALVSHGASATYSYTAVIAPLGGGPLVRCPGDYAERIEWEPRGELLLIGNALGYRIHDAAGELICADATARGLSATCFVFTPPHGELVCIRRNVLGGVELGSDRGLPCIDLASLPLGAQPHWRPTGLDVREAGDLVALSPCNADVFVLERESGNLVVHLRIEGVQIVDMKLAFDASGRYLLMSATHIRARTITHLIYDGVRGELVGGLTTEAGTFGHHARVVMSREHQRVYAADQTTIRVARLPTA